MSICSGEDLTELHWRDWSEAARAADAYAMSIRKECCKSVCKRLKVDKEYDGKVPDLNLALCNVIFETSVCR